MADMLERLKQALEDRYTIGREVGRGGMAIVYLAEEHRPNRLVAIKVLDPDVASLLVRRRFIREVEFASKLTHPHIIPVFAAGEVDDLLYYVMPYIDGESLQQRLARDGVFSLPLALKISREVAAALHYAHEKDILHRDIKPANILLTGDDAFVADFGIARAIGVAADATNITHTDLPVGTPAYMSPEQASGGGNLDRQTDVYGLGCVLYEMLVGVAPSAASSDGDGMSSHPSDYDVPSIASARDGVPESLDRVVGKALAKDPSARYSSAAEFEHALAEVDAELLTEEERRKARRRALFGVGAAVAVALAVIFGLARIGVGAAPEVPDHPMLVVLPWQNLGPPDDEYFAYGITDAVTAQLARLDGLGIISRTSAIQYREARKSVAEIGEELGVDYVLAGTVRRENRSDPESRIRIIPELIRVSDDTHVWTDTFEEEMVDVFQVQSEIAQRVARDLNLVLLEPQRAMLSDRPTANLQAYDRYMRGREYMWHGGWPAQDANSMRIAVDMFERAIELDSSFALAYTELANAHWALFTSFVDPTESRLERWREALDKALQLEPDLPEAHLALGLHDYSTPTQPDYEHVLDEFQYVVERRPNNTLARELIAVVQAALGDWESALENAARAAELDPRSPDRAGFAGWLYLLTRRYAAAEPHLLRAIFLAPDRPDPHSNLARLYLGWHGDTAGAHQVLREMMETVDPGDAALALVQSGRSLIATGECDSVFNRLAPVNYAGPFPFNYYFVKAEFHRLRAQPLLARAYSDSLLATLLEVYEERGTDPNISWYMGYALAGLGRNEAAILQADRTVELLAVSGNALRTGYIQPNVIRIYVMAADYDSALDQIEYLLSVPSSVSALFLDLQPMFSPIRAHQRFRALVQH